MLSLIQLLLLLLLLLLLIIIIMITIIIVFVLGLELRVAKALGTRPYGQVRISAVTASAEPPVAGFFDYSAQFVHRWMCIYGMTMITVTIPIPVISPIHILLAPGAQRHGATLA